MKIKLAVRWKRSESFDYLLEGIYAEGNEANGWHSDTYFTDISVVRSHLTRAYDLLVFTFEAADVNAPQLNSAYSAFCQELNEHHACGYNEPRIVITLEAIRIISHIECLLRQLFIERMINEYYQHWEKHINLSEDEIDNANENRHGGNILNGFTFFIFQKALGKQKKRDGQYMFPDIKAVIRQVDSIREYRNIGAHFKYIDETTFDAIKRMAVDILNAFEPDYVNYLGL